MKTTFRHFNGFSASHFDKLSVNSSLQALWFRSAYKLFLTLLFTLTLSNFTIAQIVDIPDPEFKWRLLNYDLYFGIYIDTNYDGEIQVSEAEAMTTLIMDSDIFGYNIEDATGIEAFINLIHLDFSNNTLEELNIESLTSLQYLDCSHNEIEYMNLRHNTLLQTLYAHDNLQEYLDLSRCTHLTEVRLDNNRLNNFIFKNNNNTAVTDFNTSNNPNLLCIQVDDMAYSEANWTNIDPYSHFVESMVDCENYFIEPQWKMRMFFEDALGQKDTITVGYDPTASLYSSDFETRFGEMWQQIDTTKFNVYTRRLGSHTAPCTPPIDTDIVIKTNIRSWPKPNSSFGFVHGELPVTITWEEPMLDSPNLPAYFPDLVDYPRARIDLWFSAWGIEEPHCVYIIADPTPPTMILSKDISYNWPMMIGECKFSDEIFLEGPGEIGYNMGPVQLIVNPYEDVYWLSDIELIENKIKIYPNPVVDNLHIESEILTIDTIKIYDIKGNLLMLTDQILGYEVVDLSKLEAGIYQMVLSTQNKNLNLKLIKQ